MSYPASVDTGQIAPLALYDGEPNSGGFSAAVANKAYVVGITLSASVIVTSVRCRFSAGGNGHYDVGIYDATGANRGAGNLLAHAASTNTSLATAAGTLTPAFLGGNLALSPGNYWLAFWCDNATDTILHQNGSGNIPVCQSSAFAGPLPALASSLTLANDGFKPDLLGILLNSWS